MPQLDNEEEAKKVKRLRRFEEDAAQFKAENTSASMQQIQSLFGEARDSAAVKKNLARFHDRKAKLSRF